MKPKKNPNWSQSSYKKCPAQLSESYNCRICPPKKLLHISLKKKFLGSSVLQKKKFWPRKNPAPPAYLMVVPWAVRGHTEHEGNLTQLMLLRTEDEPRLQRQISGRKFMSREITTELMNTMGQTVLRTILVKVHSSVWYSTIGDETRDIAILEQLTIRIRCSVCCAWRFSWLVATPKHNRWSHHNRHKGCPTEMRSALAQCRGQAYDAWGIQHVPSEEWCDYQAAARRSSCYSCPLSGPLPQPLPPGCSTCVSASQGCTRSMYRGRQADHAVTQENARLQSLPARV